MGTDLESYKKEESQPEAPSILTGHRLTPRPRQCWDALPTAAEKVWSGSLNLRYLPYWLNTGSRQDHGNSGLDSLQMGRGDGQEVSTWGTFHIGWTQGHPKTMEMLDWIPCIWVEGMVRECTWNPLLPSLCKRMLAASLLRPGSHCGVLLLPHLAKVVCGELSVSLSCWIDKHISSCFLLKISPTVAGLQQFSTHSG